MKIYNKQGLLITDPKQKAELQKEIQTLINSRSLSSGEKEIRPNERNEKNPAFERFLKSLEAQERKTEPELTDVEMEKYYKKYNDILAKYSINNEKLKTFKFEDEKY
jgi:type VI protein secretion system component Hcp